MSNPSAVWSEIPTAIEGDASFHSFRRRERDYPKTVHYRDATDAYAERYRLEGAIETSQAYQIARCNLGVERGGLSIPEMTDGLRNPYPAVVAGGPMCYSLRPDAAMYERTEQKLSGSMRDTLYSEEAVRAIGRGVSLGEAAGLTDAALGGGALDDGRSSMAPRRPFDPVTTGSSRFGTGRVLGLRIADAFAGDRVRSAPPAKTPPSALARPMLSEHSTVLHAREMTRAEATRRDEPVFGNDASMGWPAFGGRGSLF